MIRDHDALVVGAGGAGLWAALELAQGGHRLGRPDQALPDPLPHRRRPGRRVCRLGNQEEDHWEWHMFDTIKGGDYLVDQDAAEVLAREAIETVIELEHMGLPFNRTDDGRIDQRRFGGHTRNYGEGPVKRACFAADRTGHMILQTLYQQCLKAGVKFYDEYHVVDLVTEGGELGEGGRAAGVVAYRIADGELVDPALQGGAARDRRLRPHVPGHLERLQPDRRRGVARVPARRPDAGHGVLPVPSHGDRGHRDPAVRGGPRRGRLPPRQRRLPVHGALRPQAHGAGAARHGQPGHRPGDPRRARHRRQGLRLPRRPPPRPQDDRREAAGHHGLRPGVPGHRALHGPHPDPADRALRDGRGPHQPAHPGDARRGQHRGPGPVRRRRGGLRVRPRGEPPRDELAGGPAGLRAAGRAPDGARHPRPGPAGRDRGGHGPGPRRDRGHPGPRQGRAQGGAPPRAGRRDDGRRRGLPRRGGARARPRQGRPSSAPATGT